MIPTRTRPPCERCGAPALVNISNDEGGRVTVRRLCLKCADEPAPARRGEYSLNYSAILSSVGVAMILLSVFADWLGFGKTPGFGWKQDIGVVLAGILVLVATVVRIPTLLAIGVLTGILSLLADAFHFGDDPGFGWHQVVGVFFGAVLMAAGILEARRKPGLRSRAAAAAQ